eukprot:scaffold11574_cov124-Isochrysis_galbana.AAC.3
MSAVASSPATTTSVEFLSPSVTYCCNSTREGAAEATAGKRSCDPGAALWHAALSRTLTEATRGGSKRKRARAGRAFAR